MATLRHFASAIERGPSATYVRISTPDQVNFRRSSMILPSDGRRPGSTSSTSARTLQTAWKLSASRRARSGPASPRASHVTDSDGRRQVTLSETWGDAWFRITAYFTADEARTIAGRFAELADNIEAAQDHLVAV